MTLMEKVLEEARPHMEGRGLKVADGVIGLNFVGVTLNNGRSHFIYLMRESLPSGDMIFGYGEKMIGMDAWEVACPCAETPNMSFYQDFQCRFIRKHTEEAA